MKRGAMRGFSLAELLVVVAILGVVAAAALPLVSSGNPQRLAVAAEETANLLRFALAEAQRTGGYVLVDSQSTPGKLKLYYSNSSAGTPPALGTSVVYDPLTKRAAELDVSSSAFSSGVSLTPQFVAGATWPQLLIGPGLSQLQAFNGQANKGPIQAGSGVLLSHRGNSVFVGINQVTGLVTLP